MDNTKLKNRMNGKIQELQQPAQGAEIAAAESVPAPVESGYLALNNNALDVRHEVA